MSHGRLGLKFTSKNCYYGYPSFLQVEMLLLKLYLASLVFEISVSQFTHLPKSTQYILTSSEFVVLIFTGFISQHVAVFSSSCYEIFKGAGWVKYSHGFWNNIRFVTCSFLSPLPLPLSLSFPSSGAEERWMNFSWGWREEKQPKESCETAQWAFGPQAGRTLWY